MVHQQSQLQLPQLPRSNSSMLSQKPLTQLMGPNANLGSLNLNSLMTNKSTAQHLHLLTQQQLQQNNTMHRKMMHGPNNMGNLGMVGLGSNINNIMGMRGIRPMQSMSRIRHMQSMSGGVRRPMSQDQAVAIQRMKMVKVCDICGDAGIEELLAVCSRCSDGAEHTTLKMTQPLKLRQTLRLGKKGVNTMLDQFMIIVRD